MAELESSVLDDPDDVAADGSKSSPSPTLEAATAAIPASFLRQSSLHGIGSGGGAGSAETDTVQRYRATVQARTAVTENSIDSTNKRIVSGTRAVQEATARIHDLEAFVKLKQEDLEEAKALQDVVEEHRRAVAECKAAAGGDGSPPDGAGVDPTLAAMAAQAEAELASLQSVSDMHVEIDEAHSELQSAKQALAVAQAGVESASSMLATLMARVAALHAELAQFDALPQQQQVAVATTKYSEHIGQLVV